ncbi:MAG TPA: hypothetical protein PK872_02490 [Ferruginibacter sp.]|nr:hypothetical protein [Ferruginibacter sp.]
MKKWNNSYKNNSFVTSYSFTWHRSLRRTLVLSVFMASLSIQTFSQTETFDIATYTPPKDFKKDSKAAVVNYTNVNQATGSICVIALFASTVSTGDAKKDFKKAWQELAVTPYKAEANPKTEMQTTTDGWEVVTAAAPIKLDGAELYVILTVASGFGKKMSIRTSLNDEAYTAQIDAMFASMELDKTKTSSMSNNNSTTTSITGTIGKFGLMNYTSPAGWSHQSFPDGVVFKPLDIPPGEYLSIQIMQPLNFSGSMEQALQQSFDEAAAMYNGTKMNYAGSGASYQKTEAKKSFQGWEYIRANGGIRIGTGDYPPEYGLDMFVTKINNRFERMAILKSRTINRSCSMSAFYADERQQYKTAIDNFLFSLQFTDGPQPLITQSKSLEGGGIKAVWRGISMNVSTATTSQPIGLGYNVFTPIFLSNGQAYFGPKFYSEGLNDVDTRVLAELYRRDWGTYTFSTGRGVLKMPYGDIPLRMEGNTLIITANHTDHRFYQLPSVDGAKFNGTYTMSEAYGKIPAITFSADGRFSDNGAIRVLYHEYNECINPALAPGSGAYEVKDYTITFSYSDGRKIKIAFLGTEYDINNQSPSMLRMSNNEDPMTRQ